MRAQRQKIKLLEEGGADEDDIINARCRYRGTSAEYARFSRAMDLPQQRERVYIDGLGDVGKGKYVKKKSQNAFTNDAKGDTIKTSGGITGAKKTDGWQNRHAERMYEEIRHRTTDVYAIANNTAFTIEAVEKIKQHLFFTEHRFADGSIRRFDADFEQTQAWDRLSQGKFATSDFVLLKHEYVELIQMQLHDYDYETAHEIANKYHNWAKAIIEEVNK